MLRSKTGEPRLLCGDMIESALHQSIESPSPKGMTQTIDEIQIKDKENEFVHKRDWRQMGDRYVKSRPVFAGRPLVICYEG